MYPLGRVGNFKGSAVLSVIFIPEIDFYDRLVQINAFYAVVRVHMGDVFTWDVQLQPGGAAAVKKSVRQEQEKPAAPAWFSRFAGSSKIVDTKAHGQDFLPAEALFNPFPVSPSNKGDIGDDAEKYECNEQPLLVCVNTCHEFALSSKQQAAYDLSLIAQLSVFTTDRAL